MSEPHALSPKFSIEWIMAQHAIRAMANERWEEKRREPCLFGRFWANLIDKLVIWIGYEHIMMFEENLIHLIIIGLIHDHPLPVWAALGIWGAVLLGFFEMFASFLLVHAKCFKFYVLFFPSTKTNSLITQSESSAECWSIMISSSFHQMKSIEIDVRLASNFTMNDAAVFCMDYISREKRKKPHSDR